MQDKDALSSLYAFILVVIVLFALLILWMLLSSCLGVPIRHAFSSIWDSSFAGARTRGIEGAMARRRRVLGGSEGEDWEMEFRRRPT